jgi:glycosyltransferase involved in cell wall biosynthesis
MKRKLKLLMLVDQKYPSSHVFLEEVFAKKLAKKYKITWVMKSKQSKDNIEIKTWNKNKVYVIPKHKNILLDYIQLLRDLHKIKNQINPDIVFVRNDPIMGLFASKLKKRGAMFIFQLSHLKSEETISFAVKGIYGSRIKNLFLGLTSKILTKNVMKKASHVFAISGQMVKHLHKQGIHNTSALPLGANTKLQVNQSDINAVIKKYQLTPNKTIVYVGTLIQTRNPYFLFNVIKNLKRKDPEIKLLVVGQGLMRSDMAKYKKYVIKNNLHNNIIFTGHIAREKVAAHIKAADVGLSYFPHNYELKMNSPIKLMEYMNLSLPVVCNNFNTEQKEIIAKSKGGYCVDYKVSSFCEAIYTLLSDKKLRKKMGGLNSQYIKNHRSFDILSNQVDLKLQEQFDNHVRNMWI